MPLLGWEVAALATRLRRPLVLECRSQQEFKNKASDFKQKPEVLRACLKTHRECCQMASAMDLGLSFK